MIIFRTIFTLRNYLGNVISPAKTIGFVPTMGALHAGHLSLIQESQQICDITVVSVFINPVQFNNPTDFEKYPVTTERDCMLLEQQHTDILFLPAVKEMYPKEPRIQQAFDLGSIETLWEGRYRPGHFQGVCQVVKRLLEIVEPTQLFLGQKDYQQCKVIHRLVKLMDIETRLVIVPTLREKDGLAMSSRNVRLTHQQRLQATAIYQQLIWIKKNIRKHTPEQLIPQAGAALLKAGFSNVDYVAIADAETLQPVTEVINNRQLIILIAAFMGEVRLIDNMLIS